MFRQSGAGEEFGTRREVHRHRVNVKIRGVGNQPMI
jgi:hypothetical protein